MHAAVPRPLVLPAVSLITGALLATRAYDSTLAGIAAGLWCLCVWSTLRNWRQGAPARTAAWASLVMLVLGWILAAGQPAPGRLLAGQSTFTGEIEGRVVRAPAPAGGGEQTLWLRDVRRTDGQGAPGVRVRLRVAAGREADRIAGLRHRDRIRAWVRLSLPVGFRNSQQRHPHRELFGAGIDATGSIKSPSLIERLETGRPGITRSLDELRVRARRHLLRRFTDDPTHPAILSALLLGERDALPESVRERFTESGLGHLLAISGLHTGWIAAALVMLGWRLLPGPRTRLSWLASTMTLFAIFTGSAPPVLRATACVIHARTGIWLGRQGDAGNTLALVAIGIVACSPRIVHATAFQLSFAAVASILTLVPAMRPHLPLPRWPATAVAVSAVAYLGTAPLCALRFGSLAPAALVSNLVALPFGMLAVAAGYGCLLFADVPWLGPALENLTTFGLHGLIGAADTVRAQFAGTAVAPPRAWHLIALLAGGAAWRSTFVLVRRFGVAVVALALIGLHLGAPPRSVDALTLRLVDVGQGQSTLIERAGHDPLVIDAGGALPGRPDPGRRAVLAELLATGHRRIETMVVSHDHLDHAGGVRALLRELEVGSLWLPSGWHRRSRLQSLAHLAQQRGTHVVHVSTARVSETEDRHRDDEITVLGPVRRVHESPNDDSLALLLRPTTRGARICRVLIPGDAGVAAEQQWVQSERDLGAGLLIAGHHGSRTSTGAALLAAVAPRITLISAGPRNRFGHPHADVLDRLERAGSVVRRTDRLGGLEATCRDSSGWKIRPLSPISR